MSHLQHHEHEFNGSDVTICRLYDLCYQRTQIIPFPCNVHGIPKTKRQ